MRHSFAVEVGPIGLRLGSAWPEPVKALRSLYADYPMDMAPAHFTARLEPPRPWRRWIRPQIQIGGDFTMPDAAPLPVRLGVLAAEMAMNLQIALGERRFLLLHAAGLERDGRSLILSADSGAGKSTLAVLMAERGWRFLGDEFALIEPETGLHWPFPRPASLKNESIVLAQAQGVAETRLGPELTNTPKGTIRHVRPAPRALRMMRIPAQPALILFPAFGATAQVRPVAPAEAFVRLTQASTNYARLGVRGFRGLTRLVTTTPAFTLGYATIDEARSLIDSLWTRQGKGP